LSTIVIIGAIVAIIWAAVASNARRREARLTALLREAYELGAHEGGQSPGDAPPPRSSDDYRQRSRAPRPTAAPTALPEADNYWFSPGEPICPDDDLVQAIGSGPRPIEICFTGWPDDIKEALEARAASAGFKVRTNISKRLAVLCIGEQPGWRKLEDAKAQGVRLISGSQFLGLVQRFGAQYPVT
jgi:hypothetical protein